MSPLRRPWGDERLRFERLEVALERSRNINRRILEYVESRGQALNDQLTAKVRGRTALIMGMASWPLFMALVIAAAMAFVLVSMFVMLRRLGVDEGS